MKLVIDFSSKLEMFRDFKNFKVIYYFYNFNQTDNACVNKVLIDLVSHNILYHYNDINLALVEFYSIINIIIQTHAPLIKKNTHIKCNM